VETRTPRIRTKRPPRPKKSSAGKQVTLPRLYEDLAWIWPLLSPPEHYAREAALLARLYRRLSGRRARAPRPRLLELGAGGGHVLSHLHEAFDCTALDASAAMLECCERLVPGVAILRADMRSARLGKRFDLVLILDAVDYMSNAVDALAALTTAAEHLEPGGVLFVAPTYTRETFADGESASDTSPGAGVTYLSYVHDPDPADSEYELILAYLIRNQRTARVDLIEDRHVCGLFSRSQWLSMLHAAGFDASLLDDSHAWSLFGATLRAETPPAERRKASGKRRELAASRTRPAQRRQGASTDR